VSPAAAIATLTHFRLKKIGITAELVGVRPRTFEQSWLPQRRAPAMLRLRRGADAPDAGAYSSSATRAAVDAAEGRGAPLSGLPVTGLEPSAWAKAETAVSSTSTVVPLARARAWIVGIRGIAGPWATGTLAGPLWNAADWYVIDR
jgi:hypothetical protein